MEKLNSWLTLIANVGIVAGLILVAFQLQQAALFADANQTNAEFALVSGAQDIALADSLPHAWARARINAADLTEIEVSLVDTYLLRVFSNQLLEQLQASRGIGVFDEAEEAQGFVALFLGNKTALRWWESRRVLIKQFMPTFTEAVDARIAEIGPDLSDMHKREIQEIANGRLPEGVR